MQNRKVGGGTTCLASQ